MYVCVCIYIYIYIYIYSFTLHIIIFILNTHTCVFLYIHIKYTQYTPTYIMYTQKLLFWIQLIMINCLTALIKIKQLIYFQNIIVFTVSLNR